MDTGCLIPVRAVGWRDVLPLLQAGQLHVCVCQPGAGKTSLALALARDLAARPVDSVQVLYISTDLSVQVLTWKLITAMTGVSFDAMKSGTCSAAERAVVDNAQAAVASWPLILMAPTDATADHLVTLIRHCASARSTVVIVDYLGAETAGITTDSMRTMASSLAGIARELAISVIATAGYAENEDLDGVDVVLGLGLDDEEADGDQRRVGLSLLRSKERRVDYAHLVFDAHRMTHYPAMSAVGVGRSSA